MPANHALQIINGAIVITRDKDQSNEEL
jgi:hypothetical protein